MRSYSKSTPPMKGDHVVSVYDGEITDKYEVTEVMFSANVLRARVIGSEVESFINPNQVRLVSRAASAVKFQPEGEVGDKNGLFAVDEEVH